MKRNSFLGIFILIVLVAVATITQNAAADKRRPSVSTADRDVPDVNSSMAEDFSYATGQLTDASGGANVSGGAWVTNTGTGNFLQVTAGSLSYTGYPSSGIGNKLDLVSTTASAEDTYRGFTSRNSGTVYAAFMVNIQNTTGLAANTSPTGDYFAGLIASNSTTGFVDRVTIRAGSVADTYQLGLRATGNAGNTQVFSTTDLPVGTTALVVISYQIVAGATNDVCNLYVNPNITGAEPMPTITQTSAADSTDIGRFFFRQGNAGTPNASVDGVRVATSWAGLIATPTNHFLDFNGDGKTDYAVTRAESGLMRWYIAANGSTSYSAPQWGVDTDREAPADYDGDGKTDVAVWREHDQTGNPDRAVFYILRSSNGTVQIEQFGRSGDKQKVVGDYDGDGKADVAVFRENGTVNDPCGIGQSVFYYRPSGTPGTDFLYGCWGLFGDQPLAGDYDGDGRTDFAVARGAVGGPVTIYVRRSSDQGIEGVSWGLQADAFVPCDFDGDGRSDFCAARVNGTNGEFYVLTRAGGGTGASPVIFGNINPNNDQLAVGDYDGDGKSDIAILHPSGPNTTFIVRRTNDGAYSFFPWGLTGDHAVAESFIAGGN